MITVGLVLGIGLTFAAFLALCGPDGSARRQVERDTTFVDVLRRFARAAADWLVELKKLNVTMQETNEKLRNGPV